MYLSQSGYAAGFSYRNMRKGMAEWTGASR